MVGSIHVTYCLKNLSVQSAYFGLFIQHMSRKLELDHSRLLEEVESTKANVYPIYFKNQNVLFCFIGFTVEVGLLILRYIQHPSSSSMCLVLPSLPGLKNWLEINHHMPYAEIDPILSLNLKQSLNLGLSECEQRYIKFLHAQ